MRAAACRRRGEFGGQLLELGRQALLLRAQLLHALAGMLHGGDLAAHLLQKAQNLGDRRAVLALQLVDGGEARLHFFQTARIGLQARQIIAQPVGQLLQAEIGRLQVLAQPGQRGIDAAQLLERAWRPRAPA